MAIRSLRRKAGRRGRRAAAARGLGEGLAAAPGGRGARHARAARGAARHAAVRGLRRARSPRPGAGWPGRSGYRPSRKNPTVCSVCVEFSPPGGMTMHTGVLFADLRGFTARFAGADPREASALLRRFYRCAEDVLFPDALIDKLIGDEVMALYLPDVTARSTRDEVPAMMLAPRAGAAARRRLRLRRAAVRRGGHRPRRRRGVRREHRPARAVRLHRGRRRREHRLAPAGLRGRRRGRALRARRGRPARAARARASSSRSRARTAPQPAYRVALGAPGR